MKKTLAAITIVLIAIGGSACSIKDVGKKNVEIKKSFAVDRINEIEINNESWDVEFKHTESKKITIAAEGKQLDKEKDPVTIENDGNKIIVKQQDKKGGRQGFSFGKKGTILISIPQNGVDTITLNNSDGDIKMKDVTTKNIVILNEAGSEKIEGLSADKGKFTSKDGEVQLNHSSLKELTVDSTAGDIYMKSVISPKMKITSTDGEVSIKDTKEGESLFIETKSGDITVTYKEAPTSLTLTANSDSSDITVALDHFNRKNNTEKSKEGSIGDGANKVELLSKNGIINVK
ncbi:DUF4097 family beta strand repeat-containing protein [Heyndrickxia sp. NPDC080065]|uniref:DUF4097 family beta strand repeat-containing protein n=1 Tax=Heyndrickxia sp. NPDC080065 TaxID=3390568 RepID=UPI003CFFE00A